jgi:hypothetical protein
MVHLFDTSGVAGCRTPASRFWDFQWAETAIFAGLAVALAGFCVWWIRRRVA